jgi:hypothetical protein
MSTKYIRTAIIEYYEEPMVRWDPLAGNVDGGGGYWSKKTESRVFDTLAEAEQKFDKEVELVHIEERKIIEHGKGILSHYR